MLLLAVSCRSWKSCETALRLRVSWLLEQCSLGVMVREQDLPRAAHHSPRDAARLVKLGKRHVFALTYGWQTAFHPDPTGEVFRALVKVRRS